MTDLPGIDIKEVAEIVACAAIENINNPQPSSLSSGIELQADEQWMLAAYMEGIGEFQEEMDAKVRKSLKSAFGKIQQGLDQIEEAHKMVLKGVETQREGLIKLNEMCENTPLFKVASVIEKVMGISVTEDEDENVNIDNNLPKKVVKKIVKKVVIPEPSCMPNRVFQKNKHGKVTRHYQCPVCQHVWVNREAVNAHIQEVHDQMKIGLCDACGSYYTHNEESFLAHRASCST